MMRASVRPQSATAQTESGEIETPSVSAPTAIGLPITAPVAGSSVETVPRSLVTQMRPKPTATASGRPGKQGAAEDLVRRRVDAPEAARVVGDVGDSPVDRDSRGLTAERDARHHCPSGREPGQRAVTEIADPDRARAVGDPTRHAADLDGRQVARRRIDDRGCPVAEVLGPNRVADGDRVQRREPDPYLRRARLEDADACTFVTKPACPPESTACTRSR